ncbi:MAG: hypothetical protein IT208_12740 [Chthonomonadales bacterium]|nr:hypothetical protein [Chthonomonadales bacterium]
MLQEATASSRAAESPAVVRPVCEWLAALTTAAPLLRVYGGDGEAAGRACARIRRLLALHRERFGDEMVCIARAPGRVNVMGRHVDHQGGHCVSMAIGRDVCVVAGARADRRVSLRNEAPAQFPDRDFQVDEVMRGCTPGDWRGWVDGADVRERARAAAGDWSQYARAIFARLQARHIDRPLRGLNATVGGDVPVAAGLSSSSAIVVAMGEAIAALNGMRIDAGEFVVSCGEAEWYVGTRGGAGDHAAMKLARAGRLVQCGFLPFHVAGTAPFPEDCLLLVCDSHQKARKTAGARDVFNHRVACYHIGREMLRQAYPELAPAIRHLRDVWPATLGVAPAAVAEMVRRLPATMCREEVVESVSAEVAATHLASHRADVGDYPVRGVVLFGLAECARSRACVPLLEEGRSAEFGNWMRRSHDGDRVSAWDALAGCRPFSADCGDEAMADWASAARREDPRAHIALQAGAYACSTPEIDRLVDVATSVEGVLGAQIAGAGLGGCVMALVRAEARAALETALAERWYLPRGLEPAVLACRPVAGSGVLAL